MKDWFKARNIWGAAILSLSDAEAGRLAKALWSYTMTGEEQNLSGAEKGVFAIIQLTLRQDEDRETEISQKRSVAGLIGGKQKQAKEANACFATQEEAKEANASFATQEEAKEANASFATQEEAKEAIVDNKNKNKESEIDKDNIIKKTSKEKFTPPTVDEVAAYCKERGNGIDAEYFCAYYGKQNWKLSNGQRMTNWRMAVITWEKRDKESPPKPKPAGKVVNAQLYTQRDYDGKQESPDEMMARLAREYGA